MENFITSLCVNDLDLDTMNTMDLDNKMTQI